MELCRTWAIVAMEITSEQVAKSKLGAALGHLKETGVLSDEEFVALKTKLIQDHMGSGTQLGD